MTSEYMTGQGRYREESRVVRKRRGRTASRGGIGIVLLLMLLLSGILGSMTAQAAEPSGNRAVKAGIFHFETKKMYEVENTSERQNVKVEF